MKKEHMQHHYKNGTVGFGVTNKFWDTVFDTKVTADNMKLKKDDWILSGDQNHLQSQSIITHLLLSLWTILHEKSKAYNIC